MTDMLVPHRAEPPDNARVSARLTVWFDGTCPLCVREIALMRRLAGRHAIDFVEIGDGAGCPIDRATLLARFHAQEAGGPIVSGAEAFAAMWRAIPALRPFGLMAQNPIMLRFLEQAYLMFLRIRPRLQRLVSRLLPIPSGDGQ